MVSEVLNNFVSSMQLANGRLTFKDRDVTLKDYVLFREAILDSYLPVTKAIGFKLTSGMVLDTIVATQRVEFCAESMVQVAVNLDDKIFFTNQSQIIYASGTGEITADMLGAQGNHVISLHTNPHVTTFLNEGRIIVKVRESFRYKEMLVNRDNLEPDYFPLHSYHSIIDFVRILPFDGEIRYVLLNGLTEEQLYMFFLRLNYLNKTDALKDKEVYEWVSNLNP